MTEEKNEDVKDLVEVEAEAEAEVEAQDQDEEEKTPGIFDKVKEDEHDAEAEDVRQKAIQAYEDIMEVGRNVSAERSARLFEVAGQFLKTGLDAVNSKSEKQLKAAKLKIEAARLRVSNEMVNQINSGREVMADRNELLKQMREESKKEVVDAVAKEEAVEE